MLFLSQPVAPTSSPRSFEELRDEGRRALEAGRLAEALELVELALQRASECDDQALVDLAVCNRSALLISLGRQHEVLADLRQILIRNSDAKICSTAAYDLSRACEHSKEYKKGVFYGRIARDRALAAGRDDLLVGSYNQIGNCLMCDSFFAEAGDAYREALALLPVEPSVSRALVMVNLGYCQMMLERVREGLGLSFAALRCLRRFGARVYEAWPHLDLCYAYVDLGRYRRAREHGLRALGLAEETGDAACLKNALFLLGETERTAGDYEAAWGYFERLQEQFYPESPDMVEGMMRVGLRQVVNLRS